MSNFNEYMSTTDSSPVSKGPCDCGSSDGNVLFSDGHHYCFVCNSFTPSDNSSDKDFDYVLELANRDKWFNSDEALEFGIIDEIIDTGQPSISKYLEGFDEYYQGIITDVRKF